jgi:hypothetical protein
MLNNIPLIGWQDQMSDKQDAQRAARRLRSTLNRRLRLSYTFSEPAKWPLKRPATNYEWAHILRVMIIRRVPKMRPIHRGRLIQYVRNDLQAASDRGRIYVDSSFTRMRMAKTELDRLIGHQTLRTAPSMEDPEMGYSDAAIYRTEYTEGWIDRVPVVVQAVVDFLPTSNVLDMMLKALLDEEGS